MRHQIIVFGRRLKVFVRTAALNKSQNQRLAQYTVAFLALVFVQLFLFAASLCLLYAAPLAWPFVGLPVLTGHLWLVMTDADVSPLLATAVMGALWVAAYALGAIIAYYSWEGYILYLLFIITVSFLGGIIVLLRTYG